MINIDLAPGQLVRIVSRDQFAFVRGMSATLGIVDVNPLGFPTGHTIPFRRADLEPLSPESELVQLRHMVRQAADDMALWRSEAMRHMTD